jgi:hypothetical protein
LSQVVEHRTSSLTFLSSNSNSKESPTKLLEQSYLLDSLNTMMNAATAAGGASEPAPAEDGNSLIDLSTILDKSACYARNENAGFPWGNLFIGDSRLGMRSDADEQLIIHLSFQEFVRVRC